MKAIYYYDTPIGKIGIAETDGAISHILFDGETISSDFEEKETKTIKLAAKQLLEYFKGKRTTFDMPLLFDGTPFQVSVWKALMTIPYGETRSYKDIAIQVGCPKGPRAVGLANNRNKIPIVIPCHRVIGASGKLVGFGGGLETKQFLLDLEK